ncbi:hypothetical protein FKM82_006774 [Ascaphus truei]
MPVPPPPPPPAPPPPAARGPPAPPPPPAFSQGRTAPVKLRQEESEGRSALLSDIHKGARLKKVAQINDRSSPQIEDSKKPNREGVSSGNGRSAVAPPMGGLFAGGFPALRPPGQRVTTGNKSAPQHPGPRTSAPKHQDQVTSSTKPDGSSHNPPDPPKPASSSAPRTIAIRAAPPRPNILGPSPPLPPPTPPAGSKPLLVGQTPPALSPLKECSAKMTMASNPSLPPPPPPFPPQTEKSHRYSGTSFSFPPPPPPPHPHPPPMPPSGFPGRTAELSSPSSSKPDFREHHAPLPPPLPSGYLGRATALSDSFPPPPELREFPSLPPPPPPPPPSLTAIRRLSEALPPPPTCDQSNIPPPRPAKNTTFLPAKQSVPPPHGRIHKVAVSSGGRLAPPPVPPARSPSTELSGRQHSHQTSSGRPSTQQTYPLNKTEGMQSTDDFESKFTFHSVEEFPPPDVFELYERVYPSKVYSVQQDPSPPQRYQMR